MTTSEKISHDSKNWQTKKREIAFELLLSNIKRDGEIELHITSPYSMEPLIPEGSSVVVRLSKLQDIGIGDIVVFNRQSSLIGHRCIQIKDSFIITKGDNLSERDSLPVSSDIILGKIVSVKFENNNINLTSAEWSIKNRIIARISSWQGKLSEPLLDIESKNIRSLTPAIWVIRRSFFYAYKFALIAIIKYAHQKDAQIQTE